MSHWSSSIKEFFSFSRGERNGIIILLILIILLLFAPIFYRSLVHPIPSSDPKFYSKVDSFFATLTVNPDEILKTPVNPVETEEIVNVLDKKRFYFDPNQVSVEELVELGLSAKQANVVVNYRSKGGRFRYHVDFSKIYVIDSATYRELKPWIRISQLGVDSEKKSKKDTLFEAKKNSVIIELNTADTLELVKIRGIGKVFARRIVAYRNLLGGYVDINQLKEVFGVKPDLIIAIAPQITIDASKINHINLNLVTFEDLKKHPYVSEYQAKAIIYYRNKVGEIKNAKELVDNKILPNEKYQKIKEYLVTG